MPHALHAGSTSLLHRLLSQVSPPFPKTLDLPLHDYYTYINTKQFKGIVLHLMKITIPSLLCYLEGDLLYHNCNCNISTGCPLSDFQWSPACIQTNTVIEKYTHVSLTSHYIIS